MQNFRCKTCLQQILLFFQKIRIKILRIVIAYCKLVKIQFHKIVPVVLSKRSHITVMPNIIFQFCFIVLPVNARWFCVKERACQLLYNRGATRASSINYRIYFIFAANGLRKTLSYLWRILHLYTSSISCFLSYSCNIFCACTISHPVSAAISSTIISSLRLCRRPLRIIPSARPSRLASISYAFHVIYSTFPHRTLLFQYPYSLSPLYTPVKKKQRYFFKNIPTSPSALPP